jgi:EAL domain-containing protein (putative c-di-GMP-specific phosphodiesterase class I)
MSLAVNVSAKQFENENSMRDIFAILDETGLDPRYLELELTESALMRRAELTATILLTLRERGIQVAVDDFGTGYSSLSYLRKFPLDALKVDRSFVSQIATIPDEMTIVRAIISMSRSLNLRIIGEVVETQDQLDFLKLHQCDEAQGYHYSPPVPLPLTTYIATITTAATDLAGNAQAANYVWSFTTRAGRSRPATRRRACRPDHYYQWQPKREC